MSEPWKARAVALGTAAGLLLSACGGGASTPAATPAATSTTPASTGTPTGSPAASSTGSTTVTFPKPEVTSITFANSTPTEVIGFPAGLAIRQGFLANMGITATVVGEDAGDAAAVQALVANQAQFAMAGAGTLNTIGTDAPAVVLGVTAIRVDDALFCKASIKTAADLNGKVIAISTFGGSSNASVLLALRALKVDPSVVTIKQVGGQGSRITALKGGSIDCAPVQDTEGMTELPSPNFNMLIDLADVEAARFPVLGLVTTKDFMAKNPNTVLDVTAAILQAVNFMWTNTDETVKAYADDQQTTPKDSQPLVEAYLKLGPRSMVTVPSDWDVAVELYKANKPDAPAIDVNQLIDMSVLQKLKTMGWYAQIGDPETP